MSSKLYAANSRTYSLSGIDSWKCQTWFLIRESAERILSDKGEACKLDRVALRLTVAKNFEPSKASWYLRELDKSSDLESLTDRVIEICEVRVVAIDYLDLSPGETANVIRLPSSTPCISRSPVVALRTLS